KGLPQSSHVIRPAGTTAASASAQTFRHSATSSLDPGSTMSFGVRRPIEIDASVTYSAPTTDARVCGRSVRVLVIQHSGSILRHRVAECEGEVCLREGLHCCFRSTPKDDP